MAVKNHFKKNNLSGILNYLYVAPSIILVLGIVILPVIFVFIISFADWDLINPIKFVGLKNYINFVNDPNILNSLKNTLMVVVSVLFMPVVLGLVIAVFLKNVWFSKGFKSVFFIPIAMSGAGIAVVWQWIYANQGLINEVLINLGILEKAKSFLVMVPLNMLFIILTIAWQSTGINMILFLMGLQDIPDDILEAAKLDGANERQVFFHIILPLLKPITTVIVILNIIGSFKVFDVIWVMTSGGPYRASETLALTLYREAFSLFKIGYGSTIAVVLFIIVFVISIVYMRIAAGRRR